MKKRILKYINIMLIFIIIGILIVNLNDEKIALIKNKDEEIKTYNYETISNFKKVSAGSAHNLAIDSEGNLWAWGYNNNGQLGQNSIIKRSSIPLQVKSGIKFKEIAAGDYHSMAIDTSGNLWTWGLNDYGQLGNGSTTNAYIPVKIKVNISQITAGYKHSMAIDSERKLMDMGI